MLIYLKATFLNDLFDGNISQIFNFKSSKKERSITNSLFLKKKKS